MTSSGVNLPKLHTSVAMCTFNGSRYLSEQLNSIAHQTTSPSELVIRDDGSTDNTQAIVARFAAEVPFPVRFTRNAQRLGPASNFSACLSQCKGDIILLSDQDDIWMPDRVSRTVTAFADDPDILFTFSDAPLIDDVGQSLFRTIYQTVPISRADRALLREGRSLMPIVLRYGVLYGATMAVRADNLGEILPVPEGWSHDEWISLALSSIGSSAYLEPVVAYRQHATQSVGAGRAGWRAMMRTSRTRDATLYQREISRYAAGEAASLDHALLPKTLFNLLRQKRLFLEQRVELRSGEIRLSKIIDMVRLWKDYKTFAAGARSVAKDISALIKV